MDTPRVARPWMDNGNRNGNPDVITNPRYNHHEASRISPLNFVKCTDARGRGREKEINGRSYGSIIQGVMSICTEQRKPGRS